MKPLAAVVAAILFCRPSMPIATATGYGKTVLDRSKSLGIDPLMVVAIVDRESRWQEGAINPKSGALGLGQVLSEFRAQCVGNVGKKTVACSEEKKRLLDGSYNLGVVFGVFRDWQTFCKKKTGLSRIEGILQAYQGLNVPKMGIWCGTKLTNGKWSSTTIPSITRQVFKRQRSLRLRLEAMGN